MPLRKYTKKKRAAPRRRRRMVSKYRSRRSYIPRTILEGFPSKKIVKLRYVDTFSLNAASGAISSDAWSCNDIYDPYTAAGGHTPLGFAEWAAIYTHYTVLGSKATLRPTASTSSNVVPMYYGMIKSTSSVPTTTFSSIHNLLESKTSGGYKVCNNQASANTDGSQNKTSIVKKFSARRDFGVNSVRDTQGVFGALVTASPVSQFYYNPWAASVNGNDPGAQTFTITIDYIVMYRDPKVLNGT